MTNLYPLLRQAHETGANYHLEQYQKTLEFLKRIDLLYSGQMALPIQEGVEDDK